MPTPPTTLDTLPNQILTEILHHLHQPFHFYHYSNALLGITDPPPESRPWNPVGLQLVCRRWREIARPLFYHQVAFNADNTTALERANAALERDPTHPLRYSQESIWIDIDSSDWIVFRSVFVEVSSEVVVDATSVALAGPDTFTISCHSGIVERIFVVQENISPKQVGSLPDELGWTLPTEEDAFDSASSSWPPDLHPNHLLTLRLPLEKLPIILASSTRTSIAWPYSLDSNSTSLSTFPPPSSQPCSSLWLRSSNIARYPRDGISSSSIREG